MQCLFHSRGTAGRICDSVHRNRLKGVYTNRFQSMSARPLWRASGEGAGWIRTDAGRRGPAYTGNPVVGEAPPGGGLSRK
jgi:hypothetical protein